MIHFSHVVATYLFLNLPDIFEAWGDAYVKTFSILGKWLMF